jgi:hypothetical protein
MHICNIVQKKQWFNKIYQLKNLEASIKSKTEKNSPEGDPSQTPGS